MKRHSGIALADAAEQAQAERRAFDVERLVVLEHAQGLLQVERRRAGVDRLEEQAEAQPVEELVGLRDIGPARIEHERLEPRRRHAEAAHRVVHHEEHRSAVDAAREADADRRGAAGHAIDVLQPAGHFVGERADVALADHVQVGGQRRRVRV